MVKSADLIGVPFAWGGRGPDSFDCYGLVREMRARAALPIPEFTSPSRLAVIESTMALERESARWVQKDEPAPGLIVLLSIGRTRRFAAHVGFVLPEHRMLHVWAESHGVVNERLEAWRHRLVGFYDYLGQ